MKLKYLRSALPDLLWFGTYYRRIFPQGERRALAKRREVEALLRANPFVGHPLEGVPDIRVFPIAKTPFVIVYRVRSDRIEVLRVRDGRKKPENLSL